MGKPHVMSTAVCAAFKEAYTTLGGGVFSSNAKSCWKVELAGILAVTDSSS